MKKLHPKTDAGPRTDERTRDIEAVNDHMREKAGERLDELKDRIHELARRR